MCQLLFVWNHVTTHGLLIFLKCKIPIIGKRTLKYISNSRIKELNLSQIGLQEWANWQEFLEKPQGCCISDQPLGAAQAKRWS